MINDKFETVWNATAMSFTTEVPALWTEPEVELVRRAYREALMLAFKRYAATTLVVFARRYPALEIDPDQWEAFVATGQELTISRWNAWKQRPESVSATAP